MSTQIYRSVWMFYHMAFETVQTEQTLHPKELEFPILGAVDSNMG
jgi:hypothetical protein